MQSGPLDGHMAASRLWPLALLIGCAAPDLRTAAMHEHLLRESAVWTARDPSLVEARYARMASHPYDFYRGSAGWYYADLARPTGARQEMPELGDADAAMVLLAGDAHPENLSTMVGPRCPSPRDLSPLWDTTQSFTLEIDDLDAATWGPWLLDLRRSALGLTTLSAGLPGCHVLCRGEIVNALGEAYADELVQLGAQGAPWRATDRGAETVAGAADHGLGALLEDVLEAATEDGPGESRLGDWTNPGADGELTLLRSWAPDEKGRMTVELSDEEAAQVAALWASWASGARSGLRLRDAVRLYGVGVSSLPATRYLALIDTGEAGSDDDALLMLREVVDPPTLPGDDGSGSLFEDNAARIRAASAAVWSSPTADGCADAVMDGDQAFKALSYTSWNQDVDRADIEEGWAEGDLVQADLLPLGAALGRLLAGAHARGGTAAGADSLGPVLAEVSALDDEAPGTALGLRLSAMAEADHAVLLEDHARLLELLDTWGPALGAELIQDDL